MPQKSLRNSSFFGLILDERSKKADASTSAFSQTNHRTEALVSTFFGIATSLEPQKVFTVNLDRPCLIQGGPMARFNTRIELHYATAHDYKILSDAMSARGFKGYVEGSDSKYYELPPGEYAYEGDKTGEQVRDLATQAGNVTGKNFAVRVTKGESFWRSLKEIANPSKSYSAFY